MYPAAVDHVSCARWSCILRPVIMYPAVSDHVSCGQWSCILRPVAGHWAPAGLVSPSRRYSLNLWQNVHGQGHCISTTQVPQLCLTYRRWYVQKHHFLQQQPHLQRLRYMPSQIPHLSWRTRLWISLPHPVCLVPPTVSAQIRHHFSESSLGIMHLTFTQHLSSA